VFARNKVKLWILDAHVMLQEELHQQAMKDLGIDLAYEPKGSATILQKTCRLSRFVTLFNDEQAITLSYEKVNLVYELERDVIDLQRNLLIYKETASDDSSARFNSLMKSVKASLMFF
jgi:glutathione synthase/RimK-type ligase-like ATP-grasp enzyme